MYNIKSIEKYTVLSDNKSTKTIHNSDNKLDIINTIKEKALIKDITDDLNIL